MAPAPNKNLKTSNLKTAALLWPELNIETSKLQNFWISVAPAANQKLKTSKQLDYCDRSSKSKPQNFKTPKIQNPLPGCGPSCKSKQQLRNSRIILSPAANQKLTTKPENCSISLTESENGRHVKTAGLP